LPRIPPPHQTASKWSKSNAESYETKRSGICEGLSQITLDVSARLQVELFEQLRGHGDGVIALDASESLFPAFCFTKVISL
jgi:hypothetical protein